MLIYNPHNRNLLESRVKLAEIILSQIKAKHCFITGSFLFSDNFRDIDVFVISRTKKKMVTDVKGVKVTNIDFNSLHSLFYHSISRSCISKSFLPQRDIKATFSNYWQVINEAVPEIMNNKTNYRKAARSLVMYTEFLRSGKVLDSFEINQMTLRFKGYKDVFDYLMREVPFVVRNATAISYMRRFLYTQAGIYRDLLEYDSQRFLNDLVHSITRGISVGRPCKVQA